MIIAKEFPKKEFNSRDDLFKALRENKSNLISLKKSTEKKADSFNGYHCDESIKNNLQNKAEGESEENMDSITVKIVINTTNFLDSHGDVHIDGIWNKSVKDNASFLHLQEHEREFDKVISDNAIGSVKSMEWSKLGLPYIGKTQALIFDSVIDKKRNEFMLNQYKNGWVKNHSVGMRYVSMHLCLNSETKWDEEEKANWDKYYPVIANKELADEKGYFWAVTEAKIIEGSAVVMGSNSATPTLETKTEAVNDTADIKEEPSTDTQKEQEKELLKELLKKLN